MRECSSARQARSGYKKRRASSSASRTDRVRTRSRRTCSTRWRAGRRASSAATATCSTCASARPATFPRRARWLTLRSERERSKSLLLLSLPPIPPAAIPPHPHRSPSTSPAPQSDLRLAALETLVSSVKLEPYNWTAWRKIAECLDGPEEVRCSRHRSLPQFHIQTRGTDQTLVAQTHSSKRPSRSSRAASRSSSSTSTAHLRSTPRATACTTSSTNSSARSSPTAPS